MKVEYTRHDVDLHAGPNQDRVAKAWNDVNSNARKRFRESSMTIISVQGQTYSCFTWSKNRQHDEAR